MCFSLIALAVCLISYSFRSTRADFLSCDNDAVFHPPLDPSTPAPDWSAYCASYCLEEIDFYCSDVGYKTPSCCLAFVDVVWCFANVCIDVNSKLINNPDLIYTPEYAVACPLSQELANSLTKRLIYCERATKEVEKTDGSTALEVYSTTDVFDLLLQPPAYIGFACEADVNPDFLDADSCTGCAIFEKFAEEGNPPEFCTSCTLLSNGGVAYDCSNLFPQADCASTDASGNCEGSTTQEAPTTTKTMTTTTQEPSTPVPTPMTTKEELTLPIAMMTTTTQKPSTQVPTPFDAEEQEDTVPQSDGVKSMKMYHTLVGFGLALALV
jgi:hypothetical protein